MHTAGEQELHYIAMTTSWCRLESATIPSACEIDICTFDKQELHYILMTSGWCCLKSATIKSACDIDICRKLVMRGGSERTWKDLIKLLTSQLHTIFGQEASIYALDGVTSENLTTAGWKAGEGRWNSWKKYTEISRILTTSAPFGESELHYILMTSGWWYLESATMKSACEIDIRALSSWTIFSWPLFMGLNEFWCIIFRWEWILQKQFGNYNSEIGCFGNLHVIEISSKLSLILPTILWLCQEIGPSVGLI